MATAFKKANMSAPTPECPVCMETMTVPIYQCKVGHSICCNCTKLLSFPALCPICRQEMTTTRNWQLEELVQNIKVECPNNGSGCIYTMPFDQVYNHLQTCIFRSKNCPLGVAFGSCSWTGSVKEIMQHCMSCHASNCSVSCDQDIVLSNVDIKKDERWVYVLSHLKFVYIFSVKLDVPNQMAYWTVQHVGSKKAANQYIYEIQIQSLLDKRRKVVFTDHCFDDSIRADEVFNMGKCAVMPLSALTHFIKDKMLSFRFTIKHVSPSPPQQASQSNQPNKTTTVQNAVPNKPKNKKKKQATIPAKQM